MNFFRFILSGMACCALGASCSRILPDAGREVAAEVHDHYLYEDEIQQMMKDAEAHAEEDKRRKELVTQRNMAQEMVNSAQKMLSENGDKISEELKANINAAVEDLQKVLDSENVDELKQKSDALMQAMSKAGESMYQAAQSAQQSESAAGAGADQASSQQKADDVVDADYEVKDK